MQSASYSAKNFSTATMISFRSDMDWMRTTLFSELMKARSRELKPGLWGDWVIIMMLKPYAAFALPSD